MNDLWKAAAELAAAIHPDRIAAAADAVAALESVDQFERLRPAFGPKADQALVDRFRSCWQAAPEVLPQAVSAAFRASAHVVSMMMESRESLELVWTGPKTGLIPMRQTEQVLLEVIGTARSDLFLVTYVFHRASSVVSALNAAVARGVALSILLESSTEHGGTVRGDGIEAVREAVPGASVFVWSAEARKAEGGAVSAAVHAKCVVADGRLAFITSANLTTAALERNMELGMLIRGGAAPEKLRQHLVALVNMRVIAKYE
ncbi:MAG: DISARM system phospholipase D-like protein DrmC [Thermomicrobium sp.]|nr:DISARM system phospholipase D-like protein DrmC [Thermomicrobium sp.]